MTLNVLYQFHRFLTRLGNFENKLEQALKLALISVTPVICNEVNDTRNTILFKILKCQFYGEDM